MILLKTKAVVEHLADAHTSLHLELKAVCLYVQVLPTCGRRDLSSSAGRLENKEQGG